jgi:protein phosphatase PTC7
MSLAIVSARVPRAGSRRVASSNYLLLYLSTSSLFAPAASIRTARNYSQRTLYSLPTCPLNRNSSPALSGLRTFHSSSHTWRSAPQFSYHVAASYSAKQDKFNAEANLFTRATFDPSKSSVTLKECKEIKDKRKRPQSGQDSFFFSQVGTTQTTTFGVMDGVGGWTESGIDPADFSHGVCEYMACAARAWPLDGKSSSLHPKDLLQVGYDEVIKDEKIVGGGSTACLAVAEPDGNVEVANLGDSGFMHLGLNAVRHFTFQLSKTPKRMLVQMAVFGGPTALSDPPNASSITHHHVRHGDVLVFATDGVWDNLSTQDALSIVSRTMTEIGAWVEKDGAMDVGPELAKLTQATADRKADIASLQARLAIAIAREAKETSLNTRRDGPFAKEVQKHYPGENWHGGKPDDIAAVVAVVVDNSAS